ncbi:hydantoinase B/oxoprolinase family protein [Capillimicrobium parvum]|uniref:Acetophenone carboxylase delta subunit n=1 Tax=Capillimicrobium parvum TaxID=2884022 RepID=A0A9E6XW84_9ACTN|nr:hydantoinase B/oxoprolinase family protein [Capillimicrobium parvum]UGS35570.1 Acetophenone carboxylase delta subunit [Capillimicrobium parvum]
MSAFERRLDPVTFEVLKSAFVSVCNEMALAVEMSAYSTVISEGRDYSATLYDAHGNLVAQGMEDLPSHAGTAAFTVRATIERQGIERMRPGDMFVMNDPFMGGTHLQDVRVVAPIFRQDKLVGFVATTGHWSDVGGMVPGSFYMEASEIYQEGVQIPPVPIVQEGVLNEAVLDLLLHNMRVPGERRGDLHAQIAACRAGARRLVELIDRYGEDTVADAMAQAQDYSEQLFRSEIALIPDGSYSWEDWIDQDPKTGEPQPVRLTMRIKGDQITYDVTESAPPVHTAINCTYPGLCSAIFMSTKALFPQVMMNEGLLRAIEIVVPERSIVNAPRPYPVGGMAATALERVINCILGAWSQAAPERTTAGHYNIINIVFGGRDEETGEEHVAYVWTEGGTGARATKDGVSGVMMFFSASTRNIAVEIQERRAPVSWAGYQFRQDSCGPGEHQGGHGSMRRLHCDADGLVLSAIGDREKFKPWGLFGGGEAASQHLIRYPAVGGEESLGMFFSNQGLKAGDEVAYLSTGGGGYGPPARRDVALVLDDLRNEYISEEFAARHYGVVCDVVDREALDIRVDVEATRARRSELFGAEHADPPGLETLGSEQLTRGAATA